MSERGEPALSGEGALAQSLPLPGAQGHAASTQCHQQQQAAAERALGRAGPFPPLPSGPELG